MGQTVYSSGGIGLKDHFDFITDPPEENQLFLLATGGVGRVIEGKMVPIDLTGKGRTLLIGRGADRDDSLNPPVNKLVQMF